MPLQMTEAEAAAFFTRIGRPLPRLPGFARELGVAAVREAPAEFKPVRKTRKKP